MLSVRNKVKNEYEPLRTCGNKINKSKINKVKLNEFASGFWNTYRNKGFEIEYIERATVKIDWFLRTHDNILYRPFEISVHIVPVTIECKIG